MTPLLARPATDACRVPWCVDHRTDPDTGETAHHGKTGPSLDGLTLSLFRADTPDRIGDTVISAARGADTFEITLDVARRMHRRLGYLNAVADSEPELADLAVQLERLATS